MFTSCLTTPIKMALRWFCTHTILTGITMDMIDKIPGHLNSRRTPLGELNWIFTAVTDTIAWNVLPRELFQKLFRQVIAPPAPLPFSLLSYLTILSVATHY
jgi:regulatory associated protein of mTOR